MQIDGGAKKWRAADITPVYRLQWASEVPGLLHILSEMHV